MPGASDNCPAIPNPSQADWNSDGTGDACQDGDLDALGFSGAQSGGFCPSPIARPRLNDCIELRLGTDPGVNCPATVTADDEAIDAWGPYTNNDRSVNSRDFFRLARLYGSTTSFTPDGKLPYVPRYDFTADDAINLLDVFVLGLYFNMVCLPDGDVDGVPDVTDNCLSIPNASQANWNADILGDACQDSDLDSQGFAATQDGGSCPAPLSRARLSDCIELFMGTAPGVACPATSIPNDEAMDAWGPDFNDDRAANSLDAFLLAQLFGSTTAFTPDGRLPYSPRYDLNADGAINALDVSIFNLYFNVSC